MLIDVVARGRAAVRRAPFITLIGIATICAIVLVEAGLRASSPMSQSVQLPAPQHGSAAHALRQLRDQPDLALSSPRIRAVVDGVVFGRTDTIATADRDAFLASGLWHLLAASGQNIALVMVLTCALIVGLGGGKHAGMVCALFTVPAYVVVVGSGASIVRAGVMGELGMVAWLIGRRSAVTGSLLFAACLLCWLEPGVHRGLGFQLSFACVAALAIWCTPMTCALEQRGVHRWVAAGMAASIVCSLATAPILILRTGSAPVLGGVANLIAVPLASGILIIGLPAALISCIWPAAGHLMFIPCGWMAQLLLGIAHVAANVPLASTHSRVGAIGIPTLLCASWALRRYKPEQHRSRHHMYATAIGCIGVLMLAMGVSRHGPGAPGAHQVRITVLDVGQGMAALIQTSRRSVLVDTGPPGDHVEQMAQSLGVRRLDGVVISHDSTDHRGEIRSIVRTLHPAWLLLPQGADGSWGWVRRLAPSQAACAGDSMHIDRHLTLRIYNPPCAHAWPTVTGDAHNDNAMVVVVEYGAVRVLLPADCEGPILRRLQLGHIDAMEISHHGSRDPDLATLVRDIQPAAALISVGAHNTYGHPAPESIAALRDQGIPVWRTDRQQSLMLTTDGRHLDIASGLHLT